MSLECGYVCTRKAVGNGDSCHYTPWASLLFKRTSVIQSPTKVEKVFAAPFSLRIWWYCSSSCNSRRKSSVEIRIFWVSSQEKTFEALNLCFPLPLMYTTSLSITALFSSPVWWVKKDMLMRVLCNFAYLSTFPYALVTAKRRENGREKNSCNKERSCSGDGRVVMVAMWVMLTQLLQLHQQERWRVKQKQKIETAQNCFFTLVRHLQLFN